MRLKPSTAFVIAAAAYLTIGCIEKPLRFRSEDISTVFLGSVVMLDLTSCTQGSPPAAIEVRLDIDPNRVSFGGEPPRPLLMADTRTAAVQTVRLEDSTPLISTDNDLSFLTSFIVQPISGLWNQVDGSGPSPLLVSVAPTPVPWLPPIRLTATNADILSFVSRGEQVNLPDDILPVKLTAGLDCVRALALRGTPPTLTSFTLILDTLVTRRFPPPPPFCC